MVVGLIICIMAAMMGAAQDSNPIEKRSIVSKDTILDIENVHVFEKTNKKGKTEWKATWYGVSTYITAEDAENIYNGALSYIVINHYSNGEIVRSKIITKPNN